MTQRTAERAAQVQCAWCGRVRVDGDRFEGGPQGGHLEADRSHGICPSCLHRELGRVREETGVIG
jgi:hypothetical protein